ncbi:acetyl-CoA carboxylase [Lactiplantibacillus dongliensis]|uniref:Acetyl-CoA carboxylase n=1 Tax=Lactiplantibacillus dongliensis TaxID=2559919 RepID=A0ABW1R991_9LACO|nr:acetyl-CoA carboxylase [Lactiplantibacillus dongliensis]
MNKDVRIINDRLTAQFKPVSQSRYWLQIVDNHYGGYYNVFFNHQRKWQRLRSIPLHTIKTYELAYLETVVHDLQQLTQLTIEYDGFTDQYWPQSQRLIQRKKHGYE